MQPFHSKDRPKSVEPAPGTTTACAAGALLNGLRMEEEAEAIAAAEGHQVESPTPGVQKRLGCVTCRGIALTLQGGGGVQAAQCVSSGSCELSWAKLHPEQYDGKTSAPCSGFNCGAVIDLTGDEPVAIGTCTVDRKGDEWRASAIQTLNSMQPVRPEDGFEKYDGDQSYIPPA